MIALASLLASKNDLEADSLLQRAAVGISNDPECGSLVRNLSAAKLSIWRSHGHVHDNGIFINCSNERREIALDALGFASQAAAHPENSEDPWSLIEEANANMATGDLVGALRAFSQVVANYPAYPRLSAAIFHAACLLAVLGDRGQAAQYLAYVLDDPPLAIGYGELEVRALLVVCVTESERPSADAVGRLYAAMGFAWNDAHLPPTVPKSPPDGVAFQDWVAPWRYLAECAIEVATLLLLETHRGVRGCRG
jgi:tetratricopeptide (TPR) repeat protein